MLRFGTEPDEVWWGIFAFGDLDGHEASSAVIVLPEGLQYLVVARGAAYVVDPVSAARCATLTEGGITDIAVLEPARLVLLVDRTGLTALSSAGVAWQVDHLVGDDLQVVGHGPGTADPIVARGYDPASMSPVTHSLNPQTGDVIRSDWT